MNLIDKTAVSSTRLIFAFMLVMSIAFLMTNCTEDEELSFDERMEADLDRYIKEHPHAYIDYVTLDEMNDFHKEKGIAPLTENDFTIEQWEYLQNPEDYAKPRCAGTWAVYFGDMDNNDTLSTADLYLADIGISQGCGGANVTNCPQIYQRFAQFDYKWRNTTPYPEDAVGDPCNTSHADYGAFNLDHYCDVERARQILLGIVACS